MVYLPTEILHAIVLDFRYRDGGRKKIAHLAAVNRHWQDVVESIVWEYLTISGGEGEKFNRIFLASPGRSRSLRLLRIKLENYFVVPSPKQTSHDGERYDQSSEMHESYVDENESLGNGSETNDSETNDSETNDSETNDSETNDSETNDSETIDSETHDSEVSNSERNDSERNDSERNDSERNDSEIDDSEIDDTEANDFDENKSFGSGRYKNSDIDSPESYEWRRLESEEPTKGLEEDDNSTRQDVEGKEHLFRSQSNDQRDYSIQERFSSFKAEHSRCLRELGSIWEALASRADHLRVSRISIRAEGKSFYEFLGNEYSNDDVSQRFFAGDQWLEPPGLRTLPSLPCVRVLELEHSIKSFDLWPVIITCKVARTLLALEELVMYGCDEHRNWPYLRKAFRQTLSTQISCLPSSLRTVVLSLEFAGIANQEFLPQNFLRDGRDHLSMAVSSLSMRLTTLAIRLNHISLEIFGASDYRGGVDAALFPNLRILDIRTGFERAAGSYWMRSADNYPKVVPTQFYDEEPDWNRDSNLEDWTEEDREWGYWPIRCFLLRPEPFLFDELSRRIARAAVSMPQLIYLNLEFHAYHRRKIYGVPSEDLESFGCYEGWGFYFRSSNEARCSSEWLSADRNHIESGPDTTDIERPRTEWVFQCPYRQVQWKEPEESKALWRKKFPVMDFDLLTREETEYGHASHWERRRDGKVIGISARRTYLSMDSDSDE